MANPYKNQIKKKIFFFKSSKHIMKLRAQCATTLHPLVSTQAFIFQMQPPTNPPAGSPLTEACSKIAYVNSITPKVTQTGHFSFRFHGNLVNLIQQFTSDMMYIYWNSYKPKQLTSETTLKARDHLYSLVQQQNSFYLSIWQQSPDFTANDFDEKKYPSKSQRHRNFEPVF